MLEIEGLAFSRGVFSLELGLRLEEGAYGILLGPSGSGKSTALRLVAGLLEAEAGSIRLSGRELRGEAPERRRVGMVFQDYALFPQLSVRKNIEYGPRLAGMGRAERARLSAELASSLRIEGLLERRPGGLSGGEAQRVALARSLAARPDLLLLDEPLSSLDPSLRRELRTELGSRIRAFGLMALHVTHDLEEALALGDRIFLMNGGRVVESGPPEELFERPRTAFAAAFMGRGPLIPLDPAALPGNLAETAYGRFKLSAEAADASARPSRVGPAFLFFPATEAEFRGREERPGPRADNELAGRVLDSVYRGTIREVLLELEALEPGLPPLALRLELPSELRPARGERLLFRAPPAACRIVAD